MAGQLAGLRREVALADYLHTERARVLAGAQVVLLLLSPLLSAAVGRTKAPRCTAVLGFLPRAGRRIPV
jgi:hypothetical protein